MQRLNTSVRIIQILFFLIFSFTSFAQADSQKQIQHKKRPTPVAQEEDDDALGTRAKHWSGLDAGVGIPFPSIVGFQVGFNFADTARLTGGYGTTGDWGTYSVDTKFFLSKTPATGFIGLGLDYLKGNANKLIAWDLSFTTAFVPFIQTGLDYQSDLGLHLCLSIGAAIPSGKTIILPGLAIGWYF